MEKSKSFLNRQTVVSLKWNNREAEKAILFLGNITAKLELTTAEAKSMVEV